MNQIYEDFQHRARQPFAIGLAPMEGVSDFAFRMWISAAQALDFIVTPFLRATSGYEARHIPRNFCPEVLDSGLQMKGTLVIPQIMGSDVSDVCRVSEYFLNHVSFVDLNCGCPSATVFKHGAGSALLRDANQFYKFLKGCEDRLGEKKYSVKMRLGVASPSEFPSLIEALSQLKPALVTVHGRTQKEGYSGAARWAEVEMAARDLRCPVWGSGDIVDSLSLQRRRSLAPSAVGAMIGRGVLANPWVFWGLENRCSKILASTVFWALASFAVLQDAQFKTGEAFIHAMGVIRPWERQLGVCPQKWNEFYCEVFCALFGGLALPVQLNCDPRVLSRLKQLVKFMGVGELESCRVVILRVSTVAEFFQKLSGAILENNTSME